MKEQAISKINTLGKVGYILALISKIVLIVAMVAVVLASMVMFILPGELVDFELTTSMQLKHDIFSTISKYYGAEYDAEEVIDEFNSMIESGEVGVSVNSSPIERLEITEDGLIIDISELPVRITNIRIALVLIVSLIVVVAAFVCMQFISSLCKSLELCRTPYEDSVIRNLTRLTISIIVWVAIGYIADGAIAGIFTGNYNFTLSVDFTTVVMVLLLFAANYILKYGAVLQQESDETL